MGKETFSGVCAFGLLLTATSAGIAQSNVPRCVNPIPSPTDPDRYLMETVFVQGAQEIATSTAHAMAHLGQDPFDFCFTTGRGRTLYYSGGGRQGVRFSIDDFNESYAHSSDAAGALYANVWILGHEYGHAFANGYWPLFRADPNAITRFLPAGLRPLALKHNSMLAAMINDDFVGEAFADCFGGALIGQADKRFVDRVRLQTNGAHLHQRIVRQRQSDYRGLINRVVSVGRDVSDMTERNDPHGTIPERLKFTKYGWDMAQYYGGRVSGEQLSAAIMYLCTAFTAAVNELKQQRSSDEVEDFDSTRGY